ncbi:MAG: penicillin-binding protein 2 [Gammaproteobacteria bacterium]|nr:penicillin-binding protein 2 [Gammaproteobacteria bacterium]
MWKNQRNDFENIQKIKKTNHFTNYSQSSSSFLSWRFRFVIFGFFLLISALIARMTYLTVFNRSFLVKQSNSRALRVINIPAYRGMILDRNGRPLAVSTPVDSIWMNPQDFQATSENLKQLYHRLSISSERIKHLLKQNSDREFVYLRRGVDPGLAQQIKALAIPGIYLEREYKRYYPLGEAASQAVGFTNIDDRGQAGLELAYNKWLEGLPGKEKVLKDLYGHVIAIISQISPARSGHDLSLSIDSRLQFLAYSELKATVQKFHAESGSVVILNPKTGEILAMANQPSFNPNGRPDRDYGQFRNRAVTDMFEPGSTMKAFSIASALDSGKYVPTTKIDTNPGWFMVGHNKIHDETFNHGVLTVTQVLQKSSNVGVAKMTLSLPAEHFIDLLHRVGFGERTDSGFPGESPGMLKDRYQWDPFDLATLAFGYGISVTPLQLASAYSVIADSGLKCPITFLKQDDPKACSRVMDEKATIAMREMLRSVIQLGGTGTSARIPGYQVAGKTGTAYIAVKSGYDKKRHMSSFVGMAPASDPALVVAVVIRDPKDDYYGGVVAAPAFSKIMGDSLRILNISPGED